MRRALGICVAGAAAAAALVFAGALPGGAKPRSTSPHPTLTFGVFAHTTQNMNSIVWTGTEFLYVQNTANTIWVAPPAGQPVQQFATMPNLAEETRCILSPGAHGFPPGVIFCHSPDNKIYEISADGSSVTVFATLPAPYPPAADGALAFDNVGRFGHQLVAATGRSGAATPSGGLVYTIAAGGTVHEVGSYSTPPGGADEVVIAPQRFGAVAGDALLTVDAGASGGVVAIDPRGRTRTIATTSEGPSPIAVIPGTPKPTRVPPAGLYVSDDTTGYTYVAPAAQLAGFAGDVIVGTETHARFWILEPKGRGFATIRMPDNLTGNYSLEQAIFVR
jgi:hypothetical protein